MIYAQENPSYVRYFLSEEDYIQNKIQVKPSDGVPYLKVIYNDSELPISLLKLDARGNVWEKSILSYSSEKSLESKFIFDEKDHLQFMYIYAEDEPWSVAFRKQLYDNNLAQSFYGQTSTFSFANDGSLQQIDFASADNQRYGRILFTYDHLGLIREESWWDISKRRVIKKYIYQIDIQTKTKKLWEYGKSGEEISYVELEMAPEDQLYPNPLPRTGNILDESDLVLQEIIRSGIMPPIPAYIPKLEHDYISLQNGERMEVDVIEVNSFDVVFRLINDSLRYTMPLSRVKEVKNQWGDQLYPVWK